MPELDDAVEFKLNFNKPLEEFNEAKALGITTRPVVLGPITYLALSKATKEAKADFEPISLLPKILPVYKQLLSELKAAGAEWVQIDEPILVTDKGANFESQYVSAYPELVAVAPKLLLTTFYGRLESNVNFIAKLPIAGLHIDLDRAPEQLEKAINAVSSTPIVLSLGVVSGRSVWKTDFSAAIKLAEKAISALGEDRVIVATASTVLHIPVTLASEKKLTEEQKDWFSFALEKASEVATIAAVVSGSQDAAVAAALEANRTSIAKRRDFEKNSDDSVRKRVASITPDQYERKSPFAVRLDAQKVLNLPKFPTTTIGSFPVRIVFRSSRLSLIILCSKLRKFVKLVPSSARVKSLRENTKSSSRRKLNQPFASRRKLVLTFLSMVSLSAMTWCNTLESAFLASSSLRMPGSSLMVPGMFTSITIKAS